MRRQREGDLVSACSEDGAVFGEGIDVRGAGARWSARSVSMEIRMTGV